MQSSHSVRCSALLSYVPCLPAAGAAAQTGAMLVLRELKDPHSRFRPYIKVRLGSSKGKPAKHIDNWRNPSHCIP